MTVRTAAANADIRVAVLVILGLFVAGCAESQFAAQGTKDLTRPGRTSPAYKVGNPYQIGGRWYYPRENFDHVEEGIASWYGSDFHGRSTANGERYDMNALTAAHPTLPLPSIVRVTNLENGRSLKLRVNDRGPFVEGRVIDVSRRAAQELGFKNQGIARVRVEIVADESREIAARLTGGGPPSTPVTGGIVPVSYRPSNVVTSAPAPALSAARSGEVGPSSSGSGLYVQAGAFTYRRNAEQVREHLSRLGPARVSSVERDGRELHRVRIGPMVSRREADALLAVVVAAGYPGSRVVPDCATC